MSEIERPLDDAEVEVVELSTGESNSPIRQAIAIFVTVLVVATGAYALWSGSDEQRNVSAFAPDTESPATDSAVPSTVESTTSSTTTSTTISSTTTVVPQGGEGDPSATAEDPCNWMLPNLVGRTLYETGGPLHPCLNAFVMGLGPAVIFEIQTVGEICTDNPGLYDRIESQSPAPGTPFGGGTVMISVSYYRNCSATTTMLPPPPPGYVPPPTGPPAP